MTNTVINTFPGVYKKNPSTPDLHVNMTFWTPWRRRVVRSGVQRVGEESRSGWSGAGEQGRDSSLDQRTGLIINSELGKKVQGFDAQFTDLSVAMIWQRGGGRAEHKKEGWLQDWVQLVVTSLLCLRHTWHTQTHTHTQTQRLGKGRSTPGSRGGGWGRCNSTLLTPTPPTGATWH